VGTLQKAFSGKTRELPHNGYPSSVKIVKNFMRSGTLVVLVVLLASTACSQELRFVCPVPAPTEFTQRNLDYKQAGQTGLSLDLFLTTHTARSKPLPVFVIFNGFGGEFMRTSAQSQAWVKAATHMGSQLSLPRILPNMSPKTLTRLSSTSGSTLRICISTQIALWLSLSLAMCPQDFR
jgi:hypothetical protein